MLGGAIYWRHELTDLLGGFNTNYESAADYDLYTRFAQHSTPRIIPDVLYHYTDHPDTDSHRNNVRQQAASVAIADRVGGGIAT